MQPTNIDPGMLSATSVNFLATRSISTSSKPTRLFASRKTKRREGTLEYRDQKSSLGYVLLVGLWDKLGLTCNHEFMWKKNVLHTNDGQKDVNRTLLNTCLTYTSTSNKLSLDRRLKTSEMFEVKFYGDVLPVSVPQRMGLCNSGSSAGGGLEA